MKVEQSYSDSCIMISSIYVNPVFQCLAAYEVLLSLVYHFLPKFVNLQAEVPKIMSRPISEIRLKNVSK